MLAPPATVRSAEGGVYRPNCHCHAGTRNSDWVAQTIERLTWQVISEYA